MNADDEHFQEASLGGPFLRGSAALFLLVDGGWSWSSRREGQRTVGLPRICHCRHRHHSACLHHSLPHSRYCWPAT